jgi:phosphate transport system substrate-binding protein
LSGSACSRLLGGSCLLALSLVLAACGGSAGGSEDGGLSGNIAVEGSSTLLPITQAVAEAFTAENPDVQIEVGGAGTSDGFAAFCAGETDISDASRPIDPAEEVPLCKEEGIEYIEIPVAYDGISIVVNPQNDFATDITSEELKALWEPAAEGKVERWNQVRSEWPARQITLYGPGTESGTFDFFTDEVVGEEGASRSDYQASEDDNVLVQGVAGDPNALGYFGFGYFEENQNRLKALPVNGVAPGAQTAQSGEYPLARPLFIYVNREDLDQQQELQDFVSFYLDNLNQVVEQARFVPLSESALQEARERFNNRTTGTAPEDALGAEQKGKGKEEEKS